MGTDGLVRASDEVEDQIRRVNEGFDRLHGHGCKLKMGENMIERTVRFIMRRKSCENIDMKIVRLFVKAADKNPLKFPLKSTTSCPTSESSSNELNLNCNLNPTWTRPGPDLT